MCTINSFCFNLYGLLIHSCNLKVAKLNVMHVLNKIGFNRKLVLFLVLYFLVNIKTAHGQANKFEISPVLIEGLVTLEVYDLFEDSRGVIWLSTDKGAFAYDNGRLKTYDTDNGLSENSVIRVFESPNKDIWIVTESGSINILRDQVIIKNDLLKGLSSVDLKSFYQVTFAKDKVFLNSHYCQEYIIDLSKNKLIPQNIIIDSTYFNLFLTDFYGKKVVHFNDTRYGKITVTDTRKINEGLYFRVGSSFTESKNFSIIASKGDITYVSVGSKILMVKDYELLHEFDIDNKREVLSMLVDAEGNLWVSSFGDGVYFFENGDISTNPEHFFNQLTFSKLILSSQGIIYASTLSTGIVKIQSNNLHPVLENSKIRFVANGKLENYIATNEKLIISSKHGKIKEFAFKNGYVNGVANLSNGIKIIYGINAIVVNGLDTALIADRIVNQVCEGREFLLYNMPHFALVVADKKLEKKSYVKDFSENKINTIKHLGDDIYLLGTKNGLFKFDVKLNKIEKIIELNVLSVDYYNGLYIIGTSKDGLHTLKSGKVSQYDFGIKSMGVVQVSVYNDELYAATDKGFVCAQIINDRIVLKQILTKNDLLKSSIITCFDVSGDSIYLGTTNGLFGMSRNYRKPNPNLKVEITKISGYGLVDSINNTFKPFNNSIEIFYRINGANFLSNIVTSYRVIGMDSNWIESNSNQIKLFDYPPGDYKVEIKSSIDGFEGVPIIYKFKVDTPLYWKGWVILSVFVFILVLGFVIIKFLKDKANIRNRVLMNELNVIRYQMNPHFISNTLNSLQGIILNEDFIKTNEYLSSFSNLVLRSINYSNNLFISLEDEVEYLRSYINLMRLIHDDSIEYVEVFPVDIENYWSKLLVPPFFIQPIIENAIIHGALRNPGDKIIRLIIEFDNNELSIGVADNGPGYDIQSTEIRSKFNRYGFTNINQRIKIYQELKKFKIKYQIDYNDIDLMGTKVVFTFNSMGSLKIK